MRAIRLAVIFDQLIHTGGGYQQALNAALLTKSISINKVEVIFFTTHKDNVSILSSYGMKTILYRVNLYYKIWNTIWRLTINSKIIHFIKLFKTKNSFENILQKQQIDLVYFLSPNIMACHLEKINFITTIWDLGHRDDPEFPELRMNKAFETREKLYESIIPRATAVFVDSSIGKINVLHRYGINTDRVHVMPFEAASTIRLQSVNSEKVVNIQDKYHLKVPYVYYPAQFWSHKNHVYLLEGLKRLEDNYNIIIGAIFSGSDKGNMSYVKKYSSILGLEDRIKFIGFVSNEEIPELYKQSIALVMPTYLGPTNLPPIEAFELGVPVLYSDKLGLREQVGESALLLDLKNPDSLALHLANLINSPELRKSLIEKGKEVLHLTVSNRVEILSSVIEDFSWRRICWE